MVKQIVKIEIHIKNPPGVWAGVMGIHLNESIAHGYS